MENRDAMAQRLIECAVETVYEHGLEKTTTSRIARVADLNEAYIYRCFKDKDDLLAHTFAYADNMFLTHILENFPIMDFDGIDYEVRCRVLFKKSWDYIMAHPKWLIFYVRYYYSQSFQEHSYEEHMKRYEVLFDKIKPACHPKAEVKTVLHHILDTLLGQARKQIMHPQDEKQTEDDTFWLLFSVLKCGKGI